MGLTIPTTRTCVSTRERPGRMTRKIPTRITVSGPLWMTLSRSVYPLSASFAIQAFRKGLTSLLSSPSPPCSGVVFLVGIQKGISSGGRAEFRQCLATSRRASSGISTVRGIALEIGHRFILKRRKESPGPPRAGVTATRLLGGSTTSKGE